MCHVSLQYHVPCVPRFMVVYHISPLTPLYLPVSSSTWYSSCGVEVVVLLGNGVLGMHCWVADATYHHVGLQS